MTYISDKDTNFYLEVAKGNIVGHSKINKFGHNPAATTGEDIWGGGGVYPFYPTAGVLVDIVSTEASDAAALGGAIQVVVQGLDENWAEVSETVTLTGTTPVTTMTTTFIRLFRAFVLEAGVTNTNAGIITAYARATGDGVTAGDIGIYIGATGGQTQHAIYTVPAGKSAYFIKGYVGLTTPVNTAEDGTFHWMMRLNTTGVNGAWLIQGEAGLINIGSSYWIYEYGVPAGPIPEKTDIRIMMANASSSFDCVGGFDLILVDD
jgi:hypothetical protein